MEMKKELVQFSVQNNTNCDLNVPVMQQNIYSINATTKYSWNIQTIDLSCGTGSIVINGISYPFNFTANSLTSYLSALNELGFGFFCTELIGGTNFLYTQDDVNIYGNITDCFSGPTTSTTTTTTTGTPTTSTTTTSTTLPTTSTTTTTTTIAPTTSTTTTTTTIFLYYYDVEIYLSCGGGLYLTTAVSSSVPAVIDKWYTKTDENLPFKVIGTTSPGSVPDYTTYFEQTPRNTCEETTTSTTTTTTTGTPTTSTTTTTTTTEPPTTSTTTTTTTGTPTTSTTTTTTTTEPPTTSTTTTTTTEPPTTSTTTTTTTEPPTTSTTTTTTTEPPTTSTTTTTTTTAAAGFIVRNVNGSGQIDTVYTSGGAIFYTINTGSFPITNGTEITGLATLTSSPIFVDISSFVSISCLSVYINGVLQNAGTTTITANGTWFLGNYTFTSSDSVLLEYNLGAC
jgi:hypothetical protein